MGLVGILWGGEIYYINAGRYFTHGSYAILICKLKDF